MRDDENGEANAHFASSRSVDYSTSFSPYKFEFLIS